MALSHNYIYNTYTINQCRSMLVIFLNVLTKPILHLRLYRNFTSRMCVFHWSVVWCPFSMTGWLAAMLNKQETLFIHWMSEVEVKIHATPFQVTVTQQTVSFKQRPQVKWQQCLCQAGLPMFLRVMAERGHKYTSHWFFYASSRLDGRLG